MTIVEYFSGPATQRGDHKCSVDGKKCSLKGWLYAPKKLHADPNRNQAVVFLHGHHQQRSEPCDIANAFLNEGWIVFAPLRSGNTAPGINNTGLFIDDWARKQGGDFEDKRVEYLRRFQVHDVDHALSFLFKFTFAGGEHVHQAALIGHSFGGSLAVFAAESALEHPPWAIADIQGAELSWGDDGGAWKDPLLDAVSRRKVPIYFLQPSNGASIKPTIVLAEKAAITGDHQFQATLFPPIGGPTLEKLHSNFVDTPGGVGSWAPSVMTFFARYHRIPGAP